MEKSITIVVKFCLLFKVGPGLLFRLVFGPRTSDWTLDLEPGSLAAFSIY
jgi:hypothetical protein